MTEVDSHEPYLMGHTPGEKFGVVLNLGIWVECECGWIGPSTDSRVKALQAHSFHKHLAVTYPKGEGLKVSRNESKTGWILVNESGEQASPKPPRFWPNKRVANQALAILKNGDS